MGIDQIRSASARDTYIMLLPEDERQKLLKSGDITAEDLKRVGPALSKAEMDKLFTLSPQNPFSRILFLVILNSIGKTEVQLDGLQKKLKNLNDAIAELNNLMSYSTELSMKKEEKDKRLSLWSSKFDQVRNLMNKLKDEYGDKIDIAVFFDPKEGGGMNPDPTKAIPANVAIEKIRNICSVLENEVKSLSTQIQKVNNTNNTLLETASFTSKKITDSITSIAQKI